MIYARSDTASLQTRFEIVEGAELSMQRSTAAKFTVASWRAQTGLVQIILPQELIESFRTAHRAEPLARLSDAVTPTASAPPEAAAAETRPRSASPW